MAKQYRYEIFQHEVDVESALNSGLYEGYKLIGIYTKPSYEDGKLDLIVWWEYEDTQE